MKTQYYSACSLDGFIATDDPWLDRLFPLGDPEETSYPMFIREVGAPMNRRRSGRPASR